MKALVLEDIGKLEYKDVPDPSVGSGEVLLKVQACGICSSDIPRIFTTGTYHFPTVPGHEFAGEIIACGPGVDKGLIGRRAAVFPLLPCGKCDSCREEEYARCSDYNYFGSRCDGAFAEYIAVPVWNLVLCSDRIPYSTAALCEPASVAKHCVDAGKIRVGETVAVIGTGTIGLLAALWAKIQGAEKVITVGRSDKCFAFAKSLGIDCTIDSSRDDSLNQLLNLTQGRGADVVLECVGRPEAISNAILYAKKGGRVVLTGNPYGDICLNKDVYWKILRNELTVTGTWNSSYKSSVNNWRETVEALETGRLHIDRLITHKFPLERYKEALDTVRNPGIFSLKVMFEPEGGKV